ncbi:MAG: YjjG family noncanonical pyrimidine nucleotidase [Bacteroidota bacterium]
MHKYKHLFFDLDKTLWDFTENTKDTFMDMYEHFGLHSLGIVSPSVFLDTYEIHNNKLWDLYRKRKIEKVFLSKERFILTLKDFGIDDEMFAINISEKYVEWSPYKTKLIHGTIDALKYLYEKYSLHIITNGFNEIQYKKLDMSGLSCFFKTVTTSEEAGCHKPDKRIFIYALQKASAHPSESIMTGDDISVDIIGAKEAGIDQVFLNSENILSDGCATFEIKSLEDLKKIF